MYIVILLVILGFAISFAQQINIKAKNFAEGKAVLASLEGERITFIDTVSIREEDKFEFNFEDDKNHLGFYRLSLNSKKWIDFIYDNEDVVIETDANNIIDSIAILKSESNKLYFTYIRLNNNYKTKTELLKLILARYPQENNYYQITKEELLQVEENYLYFVNVTSQTNPNSFIARYVKTTQLPIIETDIVFDKQLAYLKTHALDYVDFYDDGLIYSDAFTNKTIEYLAYFRNPQLPLELLEKEFMIAVDTLLTKAKISSIVYQHITEYLIDGFKKFGFDKVIDYIVENYIIKDDLCLDEKLGNTIERRIQQARNYKIGNIVPNIVIRDSSGSPIELNKINADRTLIIFYASWCPHCQTLLPQIYEFYKEQKEKKFEVLAVSIDTSRTDWLKFIETKKLNWLNVSALKGWNGKVATDYYLYATPTMFLIDKQLKIIAKPSSIDELRKWL